MTRRAAIARLVLGVLLACAAAPVARAQELTGTYITYLAINANGSAINNTSMHSMQYTESGAMPYSCDLYYPGSPAEAMTLEATAGGATVRAVNQYSGTQIVTTAPAAVVGRTLTWSGRFTGGVSGEVIVDVDEVLRFNTGDRFVTVQTTVTNRGTVDLTDVYFMRSGDPDQGLCNIGTAFTTNNDVLRQQPADGSALAVASAGAPQVTFGMGSFDGRARANNGGFMNTAPNPAWNMPVDQAGALVDEDIGIVFREPSLRVGAGTTFVFYYVWGPDPATVAMRLDTVACTSGMPCDDGLFCTSGDVCDGMGGCRGAARDCGDGLSCTADACDEGGDRCTNTITSGCVIAGACRATGATNPMNACLVCDPSMSTTAWSTAASGSTCNDGQYCTTGETCNGAGACSGMPRGCGDSLSCTADFCDETADACMHPATTGCVIDSACVVSGARNPANECEECRPASSTSGWTARDGEMCGSPSCSGTTLTPAGTCMAATCVAGTPMPCPGGSLCVDAFSCTGRCTADAECPADAHCTAGDCIADLPAGSTCDRAAMCATAGCADGVCCDSACDGTCQACDVEGSVGTCTLLAEGTDPDSECTPPETCDGMGICRAPPVPDAGPPDAGPGDAGPPDAGRPPQQDSGAPPRDGASAFDATSGYDLHGSGVLCSAGATPAGRRGAGSATGVLCMLLLAALAFRRSRSSP